MDGWKAAQSQDNNGRSGFEPRIKARFPLKCMKSFNLFSFNLSLHVVSRKFSIFFSSRLVWVGNQQKNEIPCMMECLSERIFTRLLLLSGREDFSIYFYKRNNFLQISRIWSIEWISTSHRRKTINTTISLPTVSTYGQSLGSAVLQQHSLNECNIFYYFMCTERTFWCKIYGRMFWDRASSVDLVHPENLFGSARNWIETFARLKFNDFTDIIRFKIVAVGSETLTKLKTLTSPRGPNLQLCLH